MDYSPYPPPRNKLDLRAVIETPLRVFVWWLGIVLLATLVGYPNVICVTPLVWLAAFQVGKLCVTRTKSVLPNRRMTEAGLAGGIFGLLQGLLFGVIVPFMGANQTDAWTQSIGLILIMLIASIWIGAGLAFLAAYLSETRRGGW
ncbi:MAG TPA: hypothetical protein VK851_01980 [Anaerolineales bacterium]|nr:hypothetical protein [Anaerolineales bacterium]